MAADPLVLQAMLDDLGRGRVNSLPLNEESRAATFRPSGVKVIQNAQTRGASSKWKTAISSGTFNDSDAAGVMGLDDFGGPRQHDPTAPRLNVCRPAISSLSVPRPSPTSQAAGGVVNTSLTTGGAVNRTITSSHSPSANTEGAESKTARCMRSASPTTGENSAQPLAGPGVGQERNPSGALLPSAPSYRPPTPAPSPTAPSSGGKPAKAEPATLGPISPPKPGRGLRASRWATGRDNSDATVEIQAPVPGQIPASEVRMPVSEVKVPASGTKLPTSDVKIPMSKAMTPEGQAMTQSRSARYPICDATRGLSNLKISDENVGAKIEPKRIDPMTGESLAQEILHAAKAWLSVNKSARKTTCGIYLRIMDPDCPVFEVAVQGGPIATHNLLNMLSQSHGGAYLELAFRGEDNQIQTYSLELETEQESVGILEQMKVLREATAHLLSEELEDVLHASSEAILAKQNTQPGFTLSPINTTTVTYPFGAPFRKKCGVNQEAKRTETPQGILISQACDAWAKSQRKTYTRDELTRIRKDKAATSMLLVDGSDSIWAVKRAGQKKETAWKDCVPKGQNGPDANVAPSSAVLDQLRQMVSEGNIWASQKGGAGL